MVEDEKEFIDIEELKTILTNLSPKNIVKYAYEKWSPCERSGYTILDLENGAISGYGVEVNQLPSKNYHFVELYAIESGEDPIKAEALFSKEEYEKYLEFKGDDPSEYTPDIISHFCTEEGIDEDERKISLLADIFEEDEYFNYNKWESGIVTQYQDIIQDSEGYFDY
ncbi:hypothetical protein [Methanobrevibacter sp. DSM 116169]|uniref:hypothetical protein n=1 Tax=Methanobrevibacter sp. DSM 116169 TaxID=3242727 RepID=UPI0038FCE876